MLAMLMLTHASACLASVSTVKVEKFTFKQYIIYFELSLKSYLNAFSQSCMHQANIEFWMVTKSLTEEQNLQSHWCYLES